jgi:BlaI family transcriptional regulator, penicillinase repressor
MKPTLPKPTDAGMAMLFVLWKRGACTVREVHEELQAEQGTGYTTVLKLMQIMTDKGLLVRDESRRAHVYSPKGSQQKTQTQLVSDLLQRAFGGASATLARVREYRLLGKTKEARLKVMAEMMNTLLLQIVYWHRTGSVAANKIISVHTSDLHSTVRGKVGKAHYASKRGVDQLSAGLGYCRKQKATAQRAAMFFAL